MRGAPCTFAALDHPSERLGVISNDSRRKPESVVADLDGEVWRVVDVRVVDPTGHPGGAGNISAPRLLIW